MMTDTGLALIHQAHNHEVRWCPQCGGGQVRVGGVWVHAIGVEPCGA